MAQKSGKRQSPPDQNPLPQNLRESAQQIWMAGLSAFAKAQSGGNKVFEALMKEGEALQSSTRLAARSQVDDIAGKASGTWDKLEQVFENRVAGALHSLGVPTHEDIATLSARVAELSALVDTLQKGGGSGKVEAETKASSKATPRAAAKASSPKKTTVTARKAPAKKAARKTATKAVGKAATTSTRAPKKSTARKVTKKAAD
jgi:poly(hydroxyalkanoate) granule-associated protein